MMPMKNKIIYVITKYKILKENFDKMFKIKNVQKSLKMFENVWKCLKILSKKKDPNNLLYRNGLNIKKSNIDVELIWWGVCIRFFILLTESII